MKAIGFLYYNYYAFQQKNRGGIIIKELIERILSEGQAINEEILKVDSFLNHQIDPDFMIAVGKEIARRFQGENVDKILTVEASGIAVALAVGLAMGVKVVYAKKKQASTQNSGVYSSKLFSFTREEPVDICVSSKFLSRDNRVLIVDDFLARGQALQALMDIVRQAGAHLVGAGIVIEKRFQGGGEPLRQQGVRIESLAVIKSLKPGLIEFDIG